MHLAVFGAGAWGTALAIAFSRAHEVSLWSLDAAQIQQMQQTRLNTQYLPGVALPENLQIDGDFDRVAASTELHLIVTPLQGLRQTVARLRDSPCPDRPLLWACKGIEAETAKLPHEIVAEEIRPNVDFGLLSGPSFASEVANAQPTAIVLSATNAMFAHHWAKQLHQPRLRIYANSDLIGAELGGGLKNVMAIASGICDGLGFGLNARAALITRGLAEITRLAITMGARQETMMGLSGMGDLLLTCTGNLSRNRRVGLDLARGRSLDAILQDLGHVAEGVIAAREATRLAKRHGIEMPICNTVDSLLHSDKTPDAKVLVEQLLSRNPKEESA